MIFPINIPVEEVRNAKLGEPFLTCRLKVIGGGEGTAYIELLAPSGEMAVYEFRTDHTHLRMKEYLCAQYAQYRRWYGTGVAEE